MPLFFCDILLEIDWTFGAAGPACWAPAPTTPTSPDFLSLRFLVPPCFLLGRSREDIYTWIESNRDGQSGCSCLALTSSSSSMLIDGCSLHRLAAHGEDKKQTRPLFASLFHRLVSLFAQDFLFVLSRWVEQNSRLFISYFFFSLYVIQMDRNWREFLVQLVT